MRKILPLTLVLVLSVVTAGMMAQDNVSVDLHAADNLWNEGNYIGALTAYIKLLNSPSGNQYLEPIALQTGELYVTDELTTDGRNPKLSPDGSLIAFETGPTKTPLTRIVKADGKHPLVVELQGTNAAFSLNGTKVAYVRIPPSPELTKAQEALDKTTEAGPERTFAQQTLTHLQAKYALIVLRDLKSQNETVLKTGDLMKSSAIVFAADNDTVFFVGAPENDTKRNDIYAVTATSTEPVAVTDGDGFKTAPVVAASGKTLIITQPAQTPFPVPQPPPPAGADTAQGQRGQRGQRGGGGTAPAPVADAAAAGGAGGGGGGGGRGGAGGAAAKFGVVDLATHKVTVVAGTTPAFSEDGSAITYVSTTAPDNFLMLMPVGGTPTTVLKTGDKLAAPAFSPDGKKITYQKMNRDDWEIYYINSDGKEEQRVTRDIQNDVLPRFLTNDRILGMSGEPRHRRSFVYDIPSMKQTRLFHNNTVRTIAPEYSWMPTPDGTRILISADRDGDTISPERGVYVVDLNRKVSKAELGDRLQKNLTSETLLSEFARSIFTPISASVQKLTSEISTAHIYEYERALVSFDSKHVSMPGNKKAIEYITAQLKSFGYEPEQQWFEARGALDGKSANVIARLTGTENPELIYTLSSHLDSVVAGPGADDDTSGIAALLEAARVMHGHPMPATIIFAAFTGEESGELGSKEFARIAKEGKWKVVGSLNNDMVGYANDSRMDNTIRYSNTGIRDIEHSAAMDFTKLILYDSHYYKGTDASNLFDAFGDVIGGIGGYPVLSSPHYHTANDLLDTLNFQQIAETSKTTLATLMYLASAPSMLKDVVVKGTEVSWTPAPEKSVKSYVVSYNHREEKATQPHVNLPGLKPGDTIMVRAVNAKGMPGWDWTRLTVPMPGSSAKH